MNDIQMIPAQPQLVLPELYQWGLALINQIQKIETPFITSIMSFISALGTEKLYIPVVLFIFWWIDEKRGFRFGFLLIVSSWINVLVKDALKLPRPFDLEPSFGLAFDSGYGFPSAYAQMSLVFWMPKAAWLNQLWTKKQQKYMRFLFWTFAIFFVLLIGFALLYLGLYFPSDLFAGWILGGIILVLWFIFAPRVEKYLVLTGLRVRNLSAAVLALLMNALHPQNRALSALFLGFCLGYNLMTERFPFSARAEVNGKKPTLPVLIIRCICGFTGMVIIFLFTRLVFPGEQSLFGSIPFWGWASPFYELGNYIRFCLLGFWASAGAPLMFQRMGLAPDNSKAAPSNSKAGKES